MTELAEETPVTREPCDRCWRCRVRRWSTAAAASGSAPWTAST